MQIKNYLIASFNALTNLQLHVLGAKRIDGFRSWNSHVIRLPRPVPEQRNLQFGEL